MYLITQIVFFLIAAALIGFAAGWSSGRRYAGVPALTAARDLAQDAKERLASEVATLKESLKAAPNPGDLVRLRQQADDLASEKTQALRQVDDLKARLAAAPTLADIERLRRETLAVRSNFENQVSELQNKLAKAPSPAEHDRLQHMVEELTGQRAGALQQVDLLRAQIAAARDPAPIERERDEALSAKAGIEAEFAALKNEFAALRAQPSAPAAEVEALKAEAAALAAQKDAALRQATELRAQLAGLLNTETLRQERDAAVNARHALETELSALRARALALPDAAELDRLRHESAARASLLEDLDVARNQLAMLLNADAMRRERDAAMADKHALENEHAALREKLSGIDSLPRLAGERDAALAAQRALESEVARLREALHTAPSRADIDKLEREAQNAAAQRAAALRQVEELKAHVASIEQWRDEAARAIEALRGRPAPPPPTASMPASMRGSNVVVIPSRAASMSVAELEDALSVAGAGLKPPVLRAPRGRPDDLTAIGGLTSAQQEWLNAQGVFHYWQIASLDIPGVAWLVANAPDAGRRVTRDNWVAQAARLVRGSMAERA